VRPAGLDRVPESARVWLDVRDDIRAGREPLARILAALDALGPERVLVLRAPFEPAPLYGVLDRRGFAHFAERSAPGDWMVSIYREPTAPAEAAPRGAAAAASPPAPPPSSVAPPAGPVVALDVRGLEPPLPMVRILEAVEVLAPGQRLEVLHDRRPLFLYPQLDARGLGHATEEPAPGTVRITIWRGGPAA
jgi:uncharacterized protein (DUF2249 family)